MVKTEITGGTNPPVLLMEYLYTIIFRGILIAYAAGGILTAIVNKQQFPIRKCLGKDAVNAAMQKFLGIIDRDNDGNLGIIYH